MFNSLRQRLSTLFPQEQLQQHRSMSLLNIPNERMKMKKDQEMKKNFNDDINFTPKKLPKHSQDKIETHNKKSLE